MKIRHSSVYIAMLFICSSAAGLYTTKVYSDSPEIYVLTYSSEPKAPAETLVKPPTVFRTPLPAEHPESEKILPAEATEAVQGTSTVAEPETITPIEVVSTEEKEQPQEVKQTTATVKAKSEPKPDVTPQGFHQEVISEIHRLTNEVRQEEGLSELIYDSTLAEIAEVKSVDMLKRVYFSHINPDGCDFTCLLKAHQYRANAWGENLIQYSSTKAPTATQLAEYFLDSWVESSGHRDNILSGLYTHEGIGIAQTENTFYVAVHFANPK